MPLQPQTGQDISKTVQATFGEAVAAYSQGDLERSETLCATILRGDPNHAHTLNLLAAVRMNQNRRQDALSVSSRAIQLAPHDEIIWTGRSDILNRCQDPQGALQAADEALRLSSSLAQALINRGIALVALYRFSEAKDSLQKAQEISPELKPVVQGNLVLLHGEEGQYETARKIADSLAIEYPEDHGFAVIRARFSMYTPSISRREEFERTTAAWQARPGLPAPLCSPESMDRTPSRKLRVGYFSSDFKDHPVAHFLKPVLSRHEKNNFETVLYDVTPDSDHVGKEIRSLGDSYHCGLDQTDDELAKTITDDKIDILVDLTGQFKDNRLNVFRFRPAPIQASWIGYSGTSGLPQMDYVVADSYVCPPDADNDFSEKIVRLPNHYLCFDPETVRDEHLSLPSDETGGVVFGSFNNHMKLNTEVIRVWSEILKRVRGARLFLKTGRFENVALRQHVRQQFESLGVTGDQLMLKGHLPRDKHLTAYNDIDIALDPFPYCGTKTTVDALSMGVPVITLVGERWVQRTSYGFLAGMGMEDHCVKTERDYIDKAIELAVDVQRLREMKTLGREKFITSPLCAPSTFTKHLETAYRSMWHAYCTRLYNG